MRSAHEAELLHEFSKNPFPDLDRLVKKVPLTRKTIRDFFSARRRALGIAGSIPRKSSRQPERAESSGETKWISDTESDTTEEEDDPANNDKDYVPEEEHEARFLDDASEDVGHASLPPVIQLESTESKVSDQPSSSKLRYRYKTARTLPLSTLIAAFEQSPWPSEATINGIRDQWPYLTYRQIATWFTRHRHFNNLRARKASIDAQVSSFDSSDVHKKHPITTMKEEVSDITSHLTGQDDAKVKSDAIDDQPLTKPVCPALSKVRAAAARPRVLRNPSHRARDSPSGSGFFLQGDVDHADSEDELESTIDPRFAVARPISLSPGLDSMETDTLYWSSAPSTPMTCNLSQSASQLPISPLPGGAKRNFTSMGEYETEDYHEDRQERLGRGTYRS